MIDKFVINIWSANKNFVEIRNQKKNKKMESLLFQIIFGFIMIALNPNFLLEEILIFYLNI